MTKDDAKLQLEKYIQQYLEAAPLRDLGFSNVEVEIDDSTTGQLLLKHMGASIVGKNPVKLNIKLYP